MSLLIKKAIPGLLLFFFIVNPMFSFAQEPGFDAVPDQQTSSTPSDQGNAFSAFAGSSAGCDLSIFRPGEAFQKLFLVCLPMVGLFVSTKALFYSASLFDNLLYFSISSAYLRLPIISEMWTSILRSHFIIQYQPQQLRQKIIFSGQLRVWQLRPLEALQMRLPVLQLEQTHQMLVSTRLSQGQL